MTRTVTLSSKSSLGWFGAHLAISHFCQFRWSTDGKRWRAAEYRGALASHVQQSSHGKAFDVRPIDECVGTHAAASSTEGQHFLRIVCASTNKQFLTEIHFCVRLGCHQFGSNILQQSEIDEHV